MLQTFKIDRFVKLFPFLLFIINFCVKLIFLTAEPISLDEPFTIYHAQFPVGTIIEQLKNYNNPPLYEIILHFWIKIFGISPFSVRLLPMLFACLSPVALYYFAKKNFSLRIAFTSGLLLTFSSLLMYYAHDCRVYSLFLLLSILSMHFYLNTLNTVHKRIQNSFLFIVTTTLLIYAHYFGAFIIFFQGLHLLVFNSKKIKPFLLYYLIIILLYLPHAYPLIIRFGDSVTNGTWLQPPSGIESLYTMIWTFSNFPFIAVICISLLVLALTKFIWLKQSTKNLNLVSLVLIWFLFPFFGMFFISFWIPMYIGRYLIFALPAYYITLVLCVEYLVRNNRYINVFLTALVICFICTLDYSPDKKQPIGEIVETIKQFKKPKTLVIVSPAHFLPMFAYNYNRNYFTAISDNKEYYLMDSLLHHENIYHIENPEQLPAISQDGYEDVLFFAAGDERNSLEDPLFSSVNNLSKLQWKKKIKPNWYLSYFKIAGPNVEK